MIKKLLLILSLLLPVSLSAQVTVTNVAVTGQTATSAQISWNTSGPATTQVLFGINGILNSNTVKDPALVTSHTATISGIFSGAVFSYAAVSVDAGAHTTQSPTQTFELCTRSGYTQVSGTVNNYYEYGGYSIAWVNNSGQSITPTVCGQPIQTSLTGALDPTGSFNVPVADNLQIVPSPSQWQVTINGTGGIGPYTNSPQTITGPSVNISATLSANATGKASHLFCDQSTNTLFPTACGIGGGGGGGSVGPGTVTHLSRFISSTNVGDGLCTDDGVTPMICPAGVSLAANALFSVKANNVFTGTTANLLIARDASGNAINAQPTDTNNVIGIAGFGAGLTGSVSFAYSGSFACQFDNQTAVGDWVILGSGSQCHDAGASEPAGIENLGRISSVNAGAGTLAGVDLGLPDSTNTSAGGGTGVVSPASCTGPLGYFQAPGNTITGDCHTSNDGAGNIGVASITTTGSGAGFIAFGQGAVPPLSDVNTAYIYPDISIPTTFGTALPAAPGTLNQILAVTGVVDSVHIKTGWVNEVAGLPSTVCNANQQAGSDLGAKINACEASLGVTKGEIWVSGGGMIATQVVTSHTLRVFAGTYTPAATISTTFSIAAPFILESSAKLICQSRDAIIKEPTQTGVWTIVTTDGAATGGGAEGANSDISVDNCHFLGAHGSVNTAATNILLGNCTRCYITNNWLDGLGGISVVIGGGSQTGNHANGQWVTDNLFTACGVGCLAAINGKDWHIDRNTFSDAGIPGGSVTFFIDVEPNANTDLETAFTINGNIIDNKNGTATTPNGIVIQNGLTGATYGPGMVASNVITGGSIDPTITNTMSNGILVDAGTRDIALIGNTIRRMGQSGLALGGNRLTVFGNTLTCVGSGGIKAVTGSGLTNSRILYNTVSDGEGNCGSSDLTIVETGGANSGNTYQGNQNFTAIVALGSGDKIKDVITGTCTLGTSCNAIPWANTYVTAPVCVATDTTGTNAVRVQSTTSTLTLTGTGTDVLSYSCSQ